MWPSIITGNESSSASADQSCRLPNGEAESRGGERDCGRQEFTWTMEGWEARGDETASCEIQTVTVRNIQHPIVPDSLAASSSLRASHCCFSNEEWKCFNIKASDFISAVSKKSCWKFRHLICFCCHSYSAHAFCFCLYCLKCPITSLYSQI